MLAALAAAVLADAAIHWATSTRLGRLSGDSGGRHGPGGRRGLRVWRRKPSALFIARVIERRRGELKNSLITFLELQADPLEDPNTAAAVGLRAAAPRERRPRAFLPPHGLRRPGMAMAGGPAPLASPCGSGKASFSIRGSAPPRRNITPPPFGGTEKPGTPRLRQKPEPLAQGRRQNATSGRTGAASPVARPVGRRIDRAAGEGADGGPKPSPPPSRPMRPSSSGSPRPSANRRPGEGSDAGSTGGATHRASQDAGTGGSPPSPESRREDTTPGGTQDVKPGPGQGESPEKQGGQDGIGGATNPPPGHSTGPVIPERPQPQGFPQEALDSLKAARRIIDQADRRLREGEASDTFLGEIGMSREEFRRFVVGWQRKLETAAGGANVSRGADRPDGGGWRPGRGPATRGRCRGAGGPGYGGGRQGRDRAFHASPSRA